MSLWLLCVSDREKHARAFGLGDRLCGSLELSGPGDAALLDLAGDDPSGQMVGSETGRRSVRDVAAVRASRDRPLAEEADVVRLDDHGREGQGLSNCAWNQADCAPGRAEGFDHGAQDRRVDRANEAGQSVCAVFGVETREIGLEERGFDASIATQNVLLCRRGDELVRELVAIRQNRESRSLDKTRLDRAARFDDETRVLLVDQEGELEVEERVADVLPGRQARLFRQPALYFPGLPDQVGDPDLPLCARSHHRTILLALRRRSEGVRRARGGCAIRRSEGRGAGAARLRKGRRAAPRKPWCSIVWK